MTIEKIKQVIYNYPVIFAACVVMGLLTIFQFEFDDNRGVTIVADLCFILLLRMVM